MRFSQRRWRGVAELRRWARKKMRRRSKLILVTAVVVTCVLGVWIIVTAFRTVERRSRGLIHAAWRSNLPAVKIMVWVGADVNFLTGYGGAMHGAAFNGRTDIMEFLYRRGAHIDTPAKFGVTPL